MPDPIKQKSWNMFDAIKAECRFQFGYEPSIKQVRWWYFGAIKGAVTDRYARVEWAKQIGSWDMVVRLCLRYTRHQVTKSGKRWSETEINSFVYWWLWKSIQSRTQAAAKNGEAFQAQTFWGWALEHKDRLEPVIPDRRKQAMRLALSKMMQGLE